MDQNAHALDLAEVSQWCGQSSNKSWGGRTEGKDCALVSSIISALPMGSLVRVAKFHSHFSSFVEHGAQQV